MKKKHSQYLEDPDKYLLKRERRVILSEGKPNEEKEKDDNEEEEEYWDYEDGGQSMEELDRLERLEELMKKFQGRGQKANLFNLWKNKPQEDLPEKKEDEKLPPQPPMKIKVPTKPKKTKEKIPSFIPLQRDNDKDKEPYISKDEKIEKPEVKLNKINLNDTMIPLTSIEVFNPYYTTKNQLNDTNLRFPKMVVCSPTMNPIGLGPLISYEPIRPIKPKPKPKKKEKEKKKPTKSKDKYPDKKKKRPEK